MDNNNKDIRKEIWCITGISASVIMILIGIMVLSPLAPQYYGETDVVRGTENLQEADMLIYRCDYLQALSVVDSMIYSGEQGLPRFPFFDRYLPEREQYEATVARDGIYELKWKRIEILQCIGDEKSLITALRSYSKISGHHQTTARQMLKRMEDK